MDPVSSADIFLFGRYRFDRRGGGLFYVDGSVPVGAGSRALDVLGVLIERAGNLVSKDEIMEAVWPGTTVEDANLTVQISALRRILDQGRSERSCIQTVAGRGYRFAAVVTRQKHAAFPSGRGTLPHGPRVPPRLSIVVLPFINLSRDRDQEYIVDAITEDLTTDLSWFDGSFVISCNTAFTYKGRRVSAKQLGAELGVRYVLEGSVQQSRKQVRVNVQLIDAETDAHVWAERLERDTGELFSLQNEITGRIAATLGVELVRAEAGRTIQQPEALDYILRGRAAALTPPTRDKYTESIRLFEHALALDPRSVEAQSRLVIELTARVLDNISDTAAADIARGQVLAEQALVAAPDNPIAHYAKGQLLRAQGRSAEAIPEYEKALARNRNWVAALAHIARCKIYLGLIEEAIPLLNQAIRLSPHDPNVYAFYNRLGQAHLLQSRTDEAIVWLEKSRGAHPAYPFVHSWLAAAYGLKGETVHAAAELAEARRLGGAEYKSSMARFRALFETSASRALYDTTVLAGLQQAGMPN